MYTLLLPLVSLATQLLYSHRYALAEMLMSSRVYRSDDCSVDNLLTIIRGELGKRVLRLGPAHIWQTFAVHRLVISFRPFTVIVSTLVRSYGADSADLTVSVYRLAGSPPIVPDPDARPSAAPGKTVDVIDPGNNYERAYLRKFTERVTDRDSMPPLALAFATHLCDAMVAEFNANGVFGRVFMVHGPMGCGKSVAARLFASHTEATLAPDYQPTKRQSTLSALVEVSASLVMVADEFDISLAHVVRQSVSGDTGTKKTFADAYDKPSWNALLDRIHRREKLVLILITNKSIDEIYAMVEGDMSLVRRGRIDMHFVHDGESGVACVKPVECAPVKVGMSARRATKDANEDVDENANSLDSGRASSRVPSTTAHDSAMSRVACADADADDVLQKKKQKRRVPKVVRTVLRSVISVFE